MLIWGAIWGAILGVLWPSYGGDLWFFGAVLGLAAGWTLRAAVRTAVRKEIAAAKAAGRPARLPEPFEAPGQAWAPAHVDDSLPGDRGAHPPPATAAPAAMGAAWDHPAHVDQPLAEAAAPALTARSDAFADTVPDDVVTAFDAPVRASPPPRPPAPPTPLEQGVAWLRNWLVQGNPIVKAGLVILFIGLSFLARFAAQAGLFPVELRLAAIGAVGVALLAIGFRQRVAKPAFGLALQGGGVAVLYLTVFAAFRVYGLIPQLVAMGLMVAVCAFSCALALLQNARALAFIAFAGGFAAPLLLSTGGGSHVALFGYYTLLNLAILFIATRRAWREINLLGFVATFGAAGAWGWMRYSEADYLSAQVFLVIFVLIYIATSILYARATPLRLGMGTSQAVDSTLVFGTPLLGFGLQAGLVGHLQYGEAFSALAFGAVYLLLTAALVRRGGGTYRLLAECFLALGIGFVTLAVPLALDARWTSAVWALEGAAAFWVGMRQSRWMPRAFGLLLQGMACVSYFSGAALVVSRWPLLHSAFLGGVLIALPIIATAWWARQALPHSGSRWAEAYAAIEARLPTPLFLFGCLLWLQAWAQEAGRHLPAQVLGELAGPAWSRSGGQWLMTGVTLLSSLGLLLWSQRARWAVASWPSRWTLPVLVLALLAQWEAGQNVTSWPAWLMWPLALALHFWLMYRNERNADMPLGAPWQRWMSLQHAGSVWLVVALLGDLLWSWVEQARLWHTAWASVVGVAAITAVLLALTVWAGRGAQRQARTWPLATHALDYSWRAAAPLAALLWLAAFGLAWTSSGRTAPLPYIPVLNPTDLVVLLALGAILLWRSVLLTVRPAPAGVSVLRTGGFWGAIGLLVLVIISTIWLRVAHHFFQVPWHATALYDSFVVQTGYAILWTLLALALMVVAHRRVARPVWLAGAGLLALVIVKLVLVDLSNRGGGERIIAFIGVGVLMLVVGYLAPLPPKSAAKPQQEIA